MNLWSTEGHIQNSSIGNGTLIFSNTGAQMFDIPVTQQYAVAYPLYGKYIYPYENMNLSLNYADAKLLSNDSIYLKINKVPEAKKRARTVQRYDAHKCVIIVYFKIYGIIGQQLRICVIQ